MAHRVARFDDRHDLDRRKPGTPRPPAVDDAKILIAAHMHAAETASVNSEIHVV